MRDAFPPARLADDADDPRRTLVAGRDQVQLDDEFFFGRGSCQRDRSSIEHFVEIGAQANNHFDPSVARDTQNGVAEAAPAHIRLRSQAEYEISLRANAGSLIE